MVTGDRVRGCLSGDGYLDQSLRPTGPHSSLWSPQSVDHERSKRRDAESDGAVLTTSRDSAGAWLRWRRDRRRIDAMIEVQVIAERIVLFMLTRGGFVYQDDFLSLRLAQEVMVRSRYGSIQRFRRVFGL